MAGSESQVAVVTGGARGIGEAIATRLAELDHLVAIIDKDPGGQLVADRLVKEGRKARFYRCDLTDRGAVARCGAELVEDVGPVSVLVNNAGWTPHGKFLAQDPDLWRAIIAVNYEAVLNTCFVFAGGLVNSRAIVNVASDAARIGVPYEAVYAGAKAAVIGFSKSLAVELGRSGVRVNVVSPGSTLTPLLEDMLSEDAIETRVRMTPLKKLGLPSDIASTVAFLAIEATHITGQVLSVNGGATRV